jgi:hypothetical protein
MGIKQKESGLYAFFQYDYKEGVFILTTGKTEDKIEREKDYQTTNSNITFEFFKPVKINFLSSEEKKFQKNLHKSGLEYWKNSKEQFVVGKTKEHMLQVENLILETLEKVKSRSRDVKGIQYKRIAFGDKDGNMFDAPKEIDIRDEREKCFFIPGKDAMIINKAGIGEKHRTILTWNILQGKKLEELSFPIRVPISNEIWDAWRVFMANIKTIKKLEKLKKWQEEHYLEL